MNLLTNAIAGVMLLPVISFGVCALVLLAFDKISNWGVTDATMGI